jgi:glucose/mannose-6-phosphate isomerase
LAFYEYFSELNHNAVVGYSFPRRLASRTRVVMLSSAWLHPRIALRYEITRELLKQAGIISSVVDSRGKGRMSQMLTLTLFGDYVSYYLAMLNGADPTSVGPIDYLKLKLSAAK